MDHIHSRPRRAVVQNHHELNAAVVVFNHDNQNQVPNNTQLTKNENQLEVHQERIPRNSNTKILAHIQRPHDRIYLTEDDKGKQMVVQRSKNVAKIQRKQRDEHFKPADLRLRGPQRPVAVGVVGSLDCSSPEDAMWRARQMMQNVQSYHSDVHRPIQEQEEQRLAEEARLKALAKNERKMKSYRVDMGNMLETNDQAAADNQLDRANDNVANNEGNEELSLEQMEMIDGYEELDQYSDDELFNSIDEAADNVMLGEYNNGNANTPVDSDSYIDEDQNENNDFLGDEHCLENVNMEAANPVNRTNRQREVAIRERQQLNMRQVIDDTAESRQLEAETKAEAARQKALKENEKKMRSYKVNMGYTLGCADGVQRASFSSTSRAVITGSTSRAAVPKTCKTSHAKQNACASNASGSKVSVVVSNVAKQSKQELDRKRQEENRQKMLAARERQQREQERMMQETAEARRLEAERKAEEARQKALKQNEKKMKSYKVTMGYTLEDYVADNASNGFYRREQDSSANTIHSISSNTAVVSHDRQQFEARDFEKNASGNLQLEAGENSIDTCELGNARSISGNTGNAMMEYDKMDEEMSSGIMSNTETVLEEIVNQSENYVAAENQEKEDDDEELTQEQRNEQRRLAILKKQEQLDKLLAQAKKAKSP